MIKFTLNGKNISANNIKPSIEQIMFNSAIEQIKNKVVASITEKEASEISIDVIGTNLESLNLNISGPKEIVDKIKASLNS